MTSPSEHLCTVYHDTVEFIGKRWMGGYFIRAYTRPSALPRHS